MTILREKNFVSTAELAQLLHVSIETIRRDFDQMEGRGLLKKTYGGAEMKETPMGTMPPVEMRFAENTDAKTAIAALAVQQIKDGQTVACDSGSSLLHTAAFLNQHSNMIYLCSDIHLVRELITVESNRVFMLGGFITPFGSSMGSYAKEFLSSITDIDVYLLSADGAASIEGLSMDIEEINLLKKRLLRKAKTKIALIDHSKFRKRGFYKLCDFDELDLLVTDSLTPKDIVERIKRSGVPVLVADVPQQTS